MVELDPTLAALESHPNIEVRLFNPFVIRSPLVALRVSTSLPVYSTAPSGVSSSTREASVSSSTSRIHSTCRVVASQDSRFPSLSAANMRLRYATAEFSMPYLSLIGEEYRSRVTSGATATRPVAASNELCSFTL